MSRRRRSRPNDCHLPIHLADNSVQLVPRVAPVRDKLAACFLLCTSRNCASRSHTVALTVLRPHRPSVCLLVVVSYSSSVLTACVQGVAEDTNLRN